MPAVIVLVCVQNFQDYILDNIEQLLELDAQRPIFVLTNEYLMHHFEQLNAPVRVLPVESLEDTYNYLGTSTLDATFRGGFWQLTSARFFYIYAFMKQHEVTDVVHFENDVLSYYSVGTLENCVDRSCMHIPFDSLERNIASIVYIPSHIVLKAILDKYDYSVDDMHNFSRIRRETNLIRGLPICVAPPNALLKEEVRFVTDGYNRFNGFIFDAAAMGQYIGGTDPCNNAEPKDTVGFVNETCVIKYADFASFEWRQGRPFLRIRGGGPLVPIFNLHIHCKNLKKFRINQQQDKMFDVVVPLGPNDMDRINQQLEHVRRNVVGCRHIYVISSQPNWAPADGRGVKVVDERVFPFNITDVAGILGKSKRNGWYLQQLLKLYAGLVIPELSDIYLVIDADTFFLKLTRFFDGNTPLYNTGDEYHPPYFEHMARMHPSFVRRSTRSGICHHMLFNKNIILELMSLIDTPFWIKFLESVDISHVEGSGASEYELYITYILGRHSDKFKIRPLMWKNTTIGNGNDENLDYISCHWYLGK